MPPVFFQLLVSSFNLSISWGRLATQASRVSRRYSCHCLSPLYFQNRCLHYYTPEVQEAKGDAEQKSENCSGSLRMPLCAAFTCTSMKHHCLEEKLTLVQSLGSVPAWDVQVGNMEPQTVVENRVRVVLIFGLSKATEASQVSQGCNFRENCVFHCFFFFPHSTAQIPVFRAICVKLSGP